MRMRRRFLKKICGAMALVMIGMFHMPVKAEGDPVVSIAMKGNYEVGQEVEFDINIANAKNFFAGAVDIKLDPSVIRILDIDKGSFINSTEFNVNKAYGSVSEAEGRARYGFTCLGNVKGFSGNGTFIIIKAKVLKKDNLLINNIPMSKEFSKDNNIIIQVVNNDPKEVKYSFTTFEIKTGQSQTASTVTPAGNTDTNTNNTNTSVSTNSTNNTNNSNVNNNSKSNEVSKPGTSENKQVLKKDEENNQAYRNNHNTLIFTAVAAGLAAAAGGLYFLYVRRKG